MNIFIVLGSLCLISYFIIKTKNEKLTKKMETRSIIDKKSSVNQKNIKKIIDDYLENYCQKQMNYNLYNRYAIFFRIELPEPDEEPERVSGLGTLYNLNFESNEIEPARNIIKQMIKDITGANVDDFTESRCINFLLKYKQIEGEERGIKKIVNQVKDMERLERLKDELAQRKSELIQGVINKA